MIRGTKSALAEAQRRWGNAAAVRDNGKARASTQALRDAARMKLVELRAIPKGERSDCWHDEYSRRLGDSFLYRYSVGHVTGGIAFRVCGQGDTWNEAFAAADKEGK